MPRLRDLDSIYFDDAPWQGRLQDWVTARAGDDPFVNANSLAVEVMSRRRDLGLRMAVNIAAHALLLFLRDRRYLNAYERRPEVGAAGGPSAARREVDAALFPAPSNPDEYYFGAAVLGGSGVRYYGDYCVVLKEAPQVVPDTTQVLDRNSYDALFPPLSECEPLHIVIARLRGRWGSDLLAMVKMKVLQALGTMPRLTTAGAASEMLLHDESFVEVHKHGTFTPDDVHEVRESAADAAVEADIVGRYQRGHPLSPEEAIWVQRRHAVDRVLAAEGVRARIIVSVGRTPR